MNHDDEDFENKTRKFSVVQQCPKCGQLSLAFRKGKVFCANCSYNEDIPMLR
ncbi:hypothetical protein HYX06_03560 [Candidatus Woesearchaeota archaeon]|nr:hypothetical protein [Candidatus Woesearchaeota archaeon]